MARPARRRERALQASPIGTTSTAFPG